MKKKQIELKIKRVFEGELHSEEILRGPILADVLPGFGQDRAPADLTPADVLSLLSAKLLLESYAIPRLTNLARGLLLFHIRFFDMVYAGKSVTAILEGLQNGDLALFRRVHDHLTDYCRRARIETVSESELDQWLANRAGGVDKRTAERHYLEGLAHFYEWLGNRAPSLASEPPPPALLPLPAISEPDPAGSERDAIQAIKLMMRADCSLAPAAFEHQIPITACLDRPLAYGGEQLKLDEIAGFMRGRHGLIAGIPGSGKSTAMRQLAYLDAGCENGQCIGYLQAPHLSQTASLDDPLMAIAHRLLARAGQGDVRRIRQTLGELDRNGLLILLIDGLEEIPRIQQDRLIEQSRSLASVYFAASPRRAATLSRKLRDDSGYHLLQFDVVELDGLSRSILIEKAAPHMGIDPGEAAVFSSLAFGGPSDLMKIPLGVVAAIESAGAPPQIRELLMVFHSLSELVRRSGDRLELTERCEDLNPASSALYAWGELLYNFWRNARPADVFDSENRPSTWITPARPQNESPAERVGAGHGFSRRDPDPLPLFEQHEESVQVRLLFREFETLLPAIFLFYHQGKRTEAALPRLRVGWHGDALAKTERDCQRIGELQRYLSARRPVRDPDLTPPT